MGNKKPATAKQRLVQINVPLVVYAEIQKQAKAHGWTMQDLYAKCVERLLADLDKAFLPFSGTDKGKGFIPFFATDKGKESRLLNLWLPRDLYMRARIAAGKHRATQTSFFYTALLRFLYQEYGGYYEFESRATEPPNKG